ncbi:MAG: DNA polymerase I [bacterium]
MACMLLVDGPAVAYRAHFALARWNLTASTGESTAAAYGFASTLLRLLKEYGASHGCVAFDTEKPTYRHELFEEYKAGRPAMPDDLAKQMVWIKEIGEGLGLRVLELDGYEADDIIGTLAVMASRAGMETVIATGDKDMLQLVDERTRVVMLSGAGRDTKVFDPAAVQAKYGVPPALMTDLFGLMGDAVDNVAGVPGIGEKTATSLVSRFGSLESIYSSIDLVSPPKAQKALKENRDKAFWSRDLVSVHTGVPLGLALEDTARRPVGEEQLRCLFTKLSFRSLLGQVIPQRACPSGESPRPAVWTEPAERGPVVCDGPVGLAVNIDEAAPALAQPLGVAVSCGAAGDYYFPVRHGEPGNVPPEALRHAIGGLLGSAEVPKTVYDAKRAALALRALGIELRGVAFDAMLARYLLSPGQGATDLASIALDYLGAIEPQGARAKPGAALVTVREASETCARRARATLGLRDPMEADLRDKNLATLLSDLELPLADVLADMERRGVRVDAAHLETLSSDLDCRLSLAEKQAYALAGRSFNLNSPREISRVLFEELGLKPKRKTKTGYSTDIGVLVELSAEHELPRKILEHRQISKLKSTYVDQLLRLRDPGTDRIHARFNQAVTATGRLSSSDPNLQNIPIKDDLGAEIRKAFVPTAAGWVMISGDYSQVELRVVAHLSGDRGLIEAFDRGEDIHANTAAAVFKVGLEGVTPAMRAVAKMVNFGIIYGMGAQSLARATGLALGEATGFLDAHRRAYPGLYGYLDQCLETARTTGYVETILGRRRYLANLKASEPALRAAAERAAINSPVQGSAADIMKIAMLKVHADIKSAGMQGGLVVQVHDELLVECPPGEKADMEAVLYKRMANAYSLAVPLKVELKSGRNWYEAH